MSADNTTEEDEESVAGWQNGNATQGGCCVDLGLSVWCTTKMVISHLQVDLFVGQLRSYHHRSHAMK